MIRFLKILSRSWRIPYLFCKNCKSIFDNCVANGFYCALKSMLAGKSAQTSGTKIYVFLAVRVFFSKFLGRSRSELY